MKDVILSIIIPVYNIERYLIRCLDSVKKQTEGNELVEVLAIDDGSTDSSGMICDEFSERWANFNVIHKTNGGLSAARNTGIRNASGRFLLFLDGDDFLCENAVERIITELQGTSKVDVLIGRYINYDLITQTYTECGYHLDKAEVEKERGNSLFHVLLKDKTYEWYAWLNIVSKDYLERNRFFFKEGVAFEDAIWTPDVLFSAQKIKYLDEPFYVYLRNRDDSITKKFSPKSYNDKKGVLEYTKIFCKKNNIDSDVEQMLWGNLNMIYTSLLFDSWMFPKTDRRRIQEDLQKYKIIYKYTNRTYQRILFNAWKLIGVKGVSFVLYIRAQWVRRKQKGYNERT